MTQARHIDSEQALEAVVQLMDGSLLREDGSPCGVLCLAGPPRSGKTTFATRALLLGLERYGDGGARLLVSGRHAADKLSRQVISHLKVSGQTRPVGTLQALAFQLLSAYCQLLPDHALPKLLNGAEQDALLRAVMAQHIAHVQAGDDCSSCQLLQRYFASELGWAGVVTKAQGSSDQQGLADQIDDEFIAQLRDMLARMIELGLDPLDQDPVLNALSRQELDLDAHDRLNLQWRLAFALWKEYAEQIRVAYPGEYRLDPSMLLIVACQAIEAHSEIALPQLLVIDDWQDLTMAGMGFIQALNAQGTRLIMVGNADESVQTFRGSYPEFLAARIEQVPLASQENGDLASARPALLPPALGCLGAVCFQLPYRPIACSAQTGSNESHSADVDNVPASYADLLAARVSLSIRNEDDQAQALFDRPGKMPHWPATTPITALDADDALLADGTVSTRLFHTPDQEEDDLIWQIKHEYLTQHWQWNDMAVIAHDNATVHAIGQKLRAEGVPVRYSSIDRPLKDEPSVQGLFALLELAQARNGCSPALADLPAAAQARWMHQRFNTLLASPLIEAILPNAQGRRPARVERIETVLTMAKSLARIGQSAQDQAQMPAQSTSTSITAFSHLQTAWQDYVSKQERSRRQAQAISGISVDDSLLGGQASPAPADTRLTTDALYFLLIHRAEGESEGEASSSQDDLRASFLESVESIARARTKDPDVSALQHALKVIEACAQGLALLGTSEPAYALWEAWKAAGKADDWQAKSLEASQEGEQANDRLDAMMRLFQFAQSSQTFIDVNDFLAQVQGMQIEADSLAHVGPVEQAVTLTTPAGAASLAGSWPLVWLPRLQEGVWPNLAARDTLFGAEDLADLMLYGIIRQSDPEAAGGHNPRLNSTLYAEEKGLLMALTRARNELRISAVWNDDTVPSDFVYGFLPEHFQRVSDMSQADFTQVGSQDGAVSRFSGLEVGPRGLVAAARSILAQYAVQEQNLPAAAGAVGAKQISAEEAADAAATLRLLQKRGLSEANPANWPFFYEQGSEDQAEVTQAVVQPEEPLPASAPPNAVTLSPSAVDNIWACPLEWAMGSQFTGPQPSSVAMSFGSLIHKVAEDAANQGLDRPERGKLGVDAVGNVELIEAATDKMMDIYHELVQGFPEFSSPKDAYDIRSRDAQVRKIVGNIASYFVMSSLDDYAHESNPVIEVGTLLRAEQEQQFKAIFAPADFTDVWNATYPDHALETEEFFALASALVGGFPKALRPDTAITLSGRIDRLEERSVQGVSHIRLVDYKTGKKGHSGPEVFNDLQLVCYQLGLAFASDTDSTQAPKVSVERLASAQPVSQAVLFDVSTKPAPAFARGPENAYQPALFAGGKLNREYLPRYYQKTVDKLARLAPLPEQVPPGVSQELWDFVRQNQSGDQGLWALTMIARVLFAAGVKLSTGLQDAVFDAERCQKKDSNGSCAAWLQLAGSVMEDRR
ncbi:ATP-dependent DNA helicase UvrD [Bombiscardovia apis]|uniref:ATP-dependent DNA helicase UvrD n=1 Tax=Bombiscardovia apis TaxID=2932182 RepID=A0ABM8BBI7_9BIFI|nr:PD-(D/E)XK nuclease family protein [Bombiscardovia apis]BDR54281.1 ATP-dependent DNA helicase UvrD [Bombiscardovia apis]